MHTRALLLAGAISLVACGSPAEPPAITPPTAPPSTDEPAPSAATAKQAATTDAAPDPQAEPQPEPEPAAPPPPPKVELASKPKFVGEGEVPKVERFLNKMREGTAACVAERGGLSAESGEMKLQFLVRTRGRAEGVDVLSSKGVSEEAERCVRELFKNKRVGTPTNDPVGVQFVYRLTPGSGS